MISLATLVAQSSPASRRGSSSSLSPCARSSAVRVLPILFTRALSDGCLYSTIDHCEPDYHRVRAHIGRLNTHALDKRPFHVRATHSVSHTRPLSGGQSHRQRDHSVWLRHQTGFGCQGLIVLTSQFFHSLSSRTHTCRPLITTVQLFLFVVRQHGLRASGRRAHSIPSACTVPALSMSSVRPSSPGASSSIRAHAATPGAVSQSHPPSRAHARVSAGVPTVVFPYAFWQRTSGHQRARGVCAAAHSCCTFPAHSPGPCMHVTPYVGSDVFGLCIRQRLRVPCAQSGAPGNVCQLEVELGACAREHVFEYCLACERVRAVRHDAEHDRHFVWLRIRLWPRGVEWTLCGRVRVWQCVRYGESDGEDESSEHHAGWV
jgi:hypothetical protein